MRGGCGDGDQLRGQSRGGPVEAACDGEVTAVSGQWQGPGQLGRGRVYLGSDAHPQGHDQAWHKTRQSSLEDIIITENAETFFSEDQV